MPSNLVQATEVIENCRLTRSGQQIAQEVKVYNPQGNGLTKENLEGKYG